MLLLNFFLFEIHRYKPKMLVDHVIFVLEDMLSIKEARCLIVLGNINETNLVVYGWVR